MLCSLSTISVFTPWHFWMLSEQSQAASAGCKYKQGKGTAVKEDCSHIVERLPKHEDHVGVRIEGLYAQAERDDDGWRIAVRCEVHSSSGDELSQPVDLVATLLDADGRVIDTSSSYIDDENFLEFEVVDINFFDMPSKPAKIRLHPKKA